MPCLYSWGANNCGQLGNNSVEDSLLPSVCPGTDDLVTWVGGGGGFSVILKEPTGQVLLSGNNDKGQQGKQDHSNNLVFTVIPTSPAVKLVKVTAGWDFIVAVREDGGVLSWGSNSFGQLGRQTASGRNSDPTPSQVTFGNLKSKAVDVKAGLRHTILLTDSQEIFTWGQGRRGQLGQLCGDGKSKSKSDMPCQIQFETQSPVVEVVAGMYHTGLLTATGQISLWGCNKYGQCCTDTLISQKLESPCVADLRLPDGDKFVSLSSGWSHLVARTAKGFLYSWGRGDLGQLGRTCPSNCDHNPKKIELSQVKSQACGSEHNLALTVNGSVYSWGWNEHGICGTGDEAHVNAPHLVEAFHQKTVSVIGCGAGHSFCITNEHL